MIRRCYVAALVLAVASAALGQSAAAPPAAPESAPGPVELPVKRVILFTSGLGFIEHQGSVTGNAAAELQFTTDQINDVLKSLVVQDADGGAVGGVRYASQQPLAKTLKSFKVDLSANPGLPELLSQVRGAEVKVVVAGEEVDGRIVGVERRETVVVDKVLGERTVVTPMLNLSTPRGLRSELFSRIMSVELQDPQLRKELNLALEAIAQRRDHDKKPVTVQLDGTGKRRVRLGYTVETPVWKTSYRLILPEAGSKDKAKLQGWAIVENATESDWTDVELSLVGGRPMSFIENLYASYYIPRPVAQPRVSFGQNVNEHADGVDMGKLRERFDKFGGHGGALGGGAGGGGMGIQPPQLALGATAGEPSTQPKPDGMDVRSEEWGGGAGASLGGNGGSGGMAAPNYMQGVAALASVMKIGQNFQFSVPKVTLPRQQSAMLPILTEAVDVEPVSIYNAGIIAGNPMLGMKLTNTSERFLLGGPFSVLETNKSATVYAGDARTDDIPPGQHRWLSYAVDQDVKVAELQDDNGPREELIGMRILKGSVIAENKLTFTHAWAIENRGKTNKTLIIEMTPQAANYEGEAGITPPPEEKTELFLRFRVAAAAGQSLPFKVVETAKSTESTEIVPEQRGHIDQLIASETTPAAVRKTLAAIQTAWNNAAATEKKITTLTEQRHDLANDQARLRANMQAAEKGSAYAADQVKAMQASDGVIAVLDEQANRARAELEKYRAEAESLVGKTK